MNDRSFLDACLRIKPGVLSPVELKGEAELRQQYQALALSDDEVARITHSNRHV